MRRCRNSLSAGDRDVTRTLGSGACAVEGEDMYLGMLAAQHFLMNEIVQ